MDNGNELMLFLYGGYGIKKGIDLCISGGLFGSSNYLGANLEFALGRRLSFAFGAHNFGNLGLDATLNTSIGIAKGVKLYAGIDSDLNLPKKGGSQFLLWLPIGVDISLRNNVNFLFETEIALNSKTYNLVGGGLNFYF